MHIFFAGISSLTGGAEFELLHLADAFRQAGIATHWVPLGDIERSVREQIEAVGGIVHAYRPGIFEGQVVLNLCNGDHIKKLPEIYAEGEPKAYIFGDCMARQVYGQEGHRIGHITHFVFQSQYQRNNHLPALEKIAPVNELVRYRPYFSWARGTEDGLWHPECACNRQEGTFAVGRISRDDYYKFPDNFWRDWQSIAGPKPVHLWVLGYGENAKRRCGEPPTEDNIHVYPPYSLPAADLLSRIHVLIHTTGGSGENWPRVLFEAWASGVVPIFERDTGAAEIITDGVDGFLVANGAEAAQKASLLAQDDALRVQMVKAGYETLLREHCDVGRSVGPFLPLLEGCPEVTDPPLRKAGIIDPVRVREINEAQNDFIRAGHSRFMVVQMWVSPDGNVHLNRHSHDFPDSHAEMAIDLLSQNVRGDVASRALGAPRKLTIACRTFPKSPMPNICRETWIPRARELGMEVLFYSGNESCEACNGQRKFEQSGDTIFFPQPTDYGSSIPRFNALSKWLAANRPDSWVFVCDDDTLILPDRLKAMLPAAGEYHGFALDTGPGTVQYASGGAGALLSPRAMRELADRQLTGNGIDDIAIGEVMRAAGIPLSRDTRFRPFRNTLAGDQNEPTRENAFVTCHCKSPGNDPYEDRIALMRRLWKECV